MTEQEANCALELDQSRVIVITKKASPGGRKQQNTGEDETLREKQQHFVKRIISKVRSDNLLILDQG